MVVSSSLSGHGISTFLRQTVTVEEAIGEVSKNHSGTAERVIIKPYPKDDELRTFWCAVSVARSGR